MLTSNDGCYSLAPWIRSAVRGSPLMLLLVCLVGLAGCSASSTSVASLDVWVETGTPEELQTVTSQVEVFNAEHPAGPTVNLRVIAEGDYGTEVQAAAASGALPDVFQVDGPMLASLEFQGALADLKQLLPEETTAAILPSLLAQGTVNDHLVGIGVYDSGLGIFGNRRLLAAAGVDYPVGVEETWTAAEFTAAVTQLAAADPDGLVLDLKRSYGVGEWLTYGFAPLIWSAGGDLVDRGSGRAEGVLDGPESVLAMTRLQEWAAYVDPDDDGDAFIAGDVALSWVGHWAYPQYAAALGDDLVVLPLPDLGFGPKTGQGSWAWGVGASSDNQQAAGSFLAFLLSAEQVERMSTANGAVPGRTDVLADSPLYGRTGPLALLSYQLDRTCGDGGPRPDCIAVRRPATPDYPMISAHVALAIDAILRGADPQESLSNAAAAIDRERASLD